MAQELIKILLYFDVFSYPLTRRELLIYAGLGGNQAGKASSMIDRLAGQGIIRWYGGFYFINHDRSVVRRRIKGNLLAEKRMRTALRYSRIIAMFPFVRGIFLSGSISKGFMSESDDVDYFIITAPGRLWLTRTLLTLFKKIFLFNSFRNFCLNYFVDSEHLYISEQNRFTATEIVFLVPVHNSPLYREILDANGWVKEFYPDFSRNGTYANDKIPVVRRLAERLFDILPAGRIDDILQRASVAYIRRKYGYLDDSEFGGRFTLLKHEMKYFPDRQQFRIMDEYSMRLKSFAENSGSSISAADRVTEPAL